MPRFKIRPADQSRPVVGIIGLDSTAVLRVIQRLECKAADVFFDGDYSYSVRRGDGGMWCIFRRDEGGEVQGGELFG
jgi:hypothetical protein